MRQDARVGGAGNDDDQGHLQRLGRHLTTEVEANGYDQPQQLNVFPTNLRDAHQQSGSTSAARTEDDTIVLELTTAANRVGMLSRVGIKSVSWIHHQPRTLLRKCRPRRACPLVWEDSNASKLCCSVLASTESIPYQLKPCRVQGLAVLPGKDSPKGNLAESDAESGIYLQAEGRSDIVAIYPQDHRSGILGRCRWYPEKIFPNRCHFLPCLRAYSMSLLTVIISSGLNKPSGDPFSSVCDSPFVWYFISRVSEVSVQLRSSILRTRQALCER